MFGICIFDVSKTTQKLDTMKSIKTILNNLFNLLVASVIIFSIGGPYLLWAEIGKKKEADTATLVVGVALCFVNGLVFALLINFLLRLL